MTYINHKKREKREFSELHHSNLEHRQRLNQIYFFIFLELEKKYPHWFFQNKKVKYFELKFLNRILFYVECKYFLAYGDTPSKSKHFLNKYNEILHYDFFFFLGSSSPSKYLSYYAYNSKLRHFNEKGKSPKIEQYPLINFLIYNSKENAIKKIKKVLDEKTRKRIIEALFSIDEKTLIEDTSYLYEKISKTDEAMIDIREYHLKSLIKNPLPKT